MHTEKKGYIMHIQNHPRHLMHTKKTKKCLCILRKTCNCMHTKTICNCMQTETTCNCMHTKTICNCMHTKKTRNCMHTKKITYVALCLINTKLNEFTVWNRQVNLGLKWQLM